MLPGLSGLAGFSGDAAPPGLPASTKFLTRFTASPPLDEVLGTSGTLVGNATADTANSRLQCDGTGDWCIFATRADFDLPGDFTVEMHTDQAAGQFGGIVGRQPASGSAGRWVIFCSGGGQAQLFADNVTGIAITSVTGLDGSEHHLAYVRESNTWRAYKDGVQTSSTSIAGTIGSASADLYIGTDHAADTSRDIAANIGRIKISNSCLYPGGTTFTPPARTDP